MQAITNLFNNYLKVFLPGIFLVLFFAIFSYLGAFLNDEPISMLHGGFDNFKLVIAFYIASQLTSWVLNLYFFKYNSLFKSELSYLFAPLISILSSIFTQIIYFIVIFYILTGLLLWELRFIFSTNLGNQFKILIYSAIMLTIAIGLIANIIGMFITNKRSNSSNNGSKSDNLDGNSNTGFQDSINL